MSDSNAGVVIVASRIRAEEKLLFEALSRRGIDAEHIDPRQWCVSLGNPGAGHPLALIREISFNRARYAARMVEGLGGVAVNPVEVIEVCGDKARTTLALAANGIPTPETMLALTPEATLAACDRLGYPVVVKPVVGSWGRLVALLPDRATAATVLEHRGYLSNPLQHIGYVQRFIDKPGRDIRIVVANDEPVAGMYRYSDDLRTNLATGSRAQKCNVDGELGKLACAAAQVVGGGALGVDLMEDGDGRLYVIEVNHAVEFRGIQQATSIDVADALVAHALRAARQS